MRQEQEDDGRATRDGGLERSDKIKGDAYASPVLWLEERLLLFLAALFLTTLFLCCHVSILPFPFIHGMCGSKRKTAIDDCIDSLKIEVKQKIDDHLGSGVEQRLTSGVSRSHILLYFVKR